MELFQVPFFPPQFTCFLPINKNKRLLGVNIITNEWCWLDIGLEKGASLQAGVVSIHDKSVLRKRRGIAVPMGQKSTGIVIPHQELWHTPLLYKYLAERVISCVHKWCDGWFWSGHVRFQGAFIEHCCSSLQGCKCSLTNHCNVNFLQVGEKDLRVIVLFFFKMNETIFCLTVLYALFCFVLRWLLHEFPSHATKGEI